MRNNVQLASVVLALVLPACGEITADDLSQGPQINSIAQPAVIVQQTVNRYNQVYSVSGSIWQAQYTVANSFSAAPNHIYYPPNQLAQGFCDYWLGAYLDGGGAYHSCTQATAYTMDNCTGANSVAGGTLVAYEPAAVVAGLPVGTCPGTSGTMFRFRGGRYRVKDWNAWNLAGAQYPCNLSTVQCCSSGCGRCNCGSTVCTPYLKAALPNANNLHCGFYLKDLYNGAKYVYLLVDSLDMSGFVECKVTNDTSGNCPAYQTADPTYTIHYL